MRLSDAIRKGVGDYQTEQKLSDGKGGRCALGCAYFGAFGEDSSNYQDVYNKLYVLFPLLSKRGFDRPRNTYISKDEQLLYMITILNDVYKWSFEKIADWVESIENSQGATLVTKVVEEPALELATLN